MSVCVYVCLCSYRLAQYASYRDNLGTVRFLMAHRGSRRCSIFDQTPRGPPAQRGATPRKIEFH